MKLDAAIKNHENINTYFGYENATPLHLAIKKNDYRMVKMLIDGGANVNAIDSFGNTTVHYAIENNVNIEILKELKKNGADLDVANNRGNTPLHVATETSTSCSYELIDYLVTNEANLNVLGGIEFTGFSPLHLLLTNHYKDTETNLETVKLLLNHGADIEALSGNGIDCSGEEHSNPDGYFCINYAMMGELDTEVLKTLIEAMPDINIVNDLSRTPLHILVKNCTTIEHIQMLLDYGADPTLKDANGWNPIHCILAGDEGGYLNNKEIFNAVVLMASKSSKDNLDAKVKVCPRDFGNRHPSCKEKLTSSKTLRLLN